VAVRTNVEVLDMTSIAQAEIVSGSLMPGPHLVLEVQDNGSGMDRETQSRIFDPFFTTKFTGRGLGLSAVQGILRAHKGALELRSRPGEGSTFRVFLPASARAIRSEPRPRERAGRGTGTVLVVDDEEIVRQTSKVSLEHAGFRVMLADSGAHAIRTLLDNNTPRIHLIVLDMSMPGMNGKDVMEKIRRRRIEIPPVLICSGHSETEVYREFSGLDIAGIIPKPFTPRQLTEKIQGALAETEGREEQTA
jgi:CheY-like chemotaxis protein